MWIKMNVMQDLILMLITGLAAGALATYLFKDGLLGHLHYVASCGLFSLITPHLVSLLLTENLSVQWDLRSTLAGALIGYVLCEGIYRHLGWD